MSGPRWCSGAFRGATQVDGKGERWIVLRVEPGGRVLHWESMRDQRTARTEAMPTHPGYPSDEAVLEAKRAARERARLYL